VKDDFQEKLSSEGSIIELGCGPYLLEPNNADGDLVDIRIHAGPHHDMSAFRCCEGLGVRNFPDSVGFVTDKGLALRTDRPGDGDGFGRSIFQARADLAGVSRQSTKQKKA